MRQVPVRTQGFAVTQTLVTFIDFAYAISFLVLISLGLALIFGLMRVVNLAHGEFIVLGGYAAIVAHQAGLPIWIAILVVPPLAVGLFGVLVERLVIRHLYGRMVDTMLATWGLSLLVSGALVTVFGNTTTGLPNPIGAVTVGHYQVGGYGLFIIGVAGVLLAAVFLVLRLTRAGLVVRGAMQSAPIVSTLGYNPQRIYMYTFAAGAALSGLAGGVIAPLTGITPVAGGQFIAKAFITVITGGASVIAGTVSASLLLGTTSKAVEVLRTPVAGEIALLLIAVVLLRLLPQGITGRYFRGAL